VPASARSPKPSAALLSAALGALVCTAPACGGSVESQTPETPFACQTGVSASPEVTSSTTLAMTQAEFTAECDARHGVFEVEPHCGGLNNCRGISYDIGTQVLTEHTCRATNTCAGYSCIICD
jgi:hypothetical protein